MLTACPPPNNGGRVWNENVFFLHFFLQFLIFQFSFFLHFPSFPPFSVVLEIIFFLHFWDKIKRRIFAFFGYFALFSQALRKFPDFLAFFFAFLFGTRIFSISANLSIFLGQKYLKFFYIF